jgi:hypothetical protein
MGRPSKAAELLRLGDSPSRIAYRMGVTVSTVLGYLYRQAGEGKIQRSDIILSIERDTRLLIEEAVRAAKGSVRPRKIKKWVRKRNPSVDEDDIQVYLNLRAARVQFGDLYESIRAIETFLHSTIKDALAEEYGERWWRQIPKDVRVDCACALESDDTPADEAFCYTTLIHLKKILDKKWPVLSRKLPAKLTKDKGAFLSRLDRLNPIRNAVMHPAKGISLDDEDFALVRTLQKELTAAPVQETWDKLLARVPVSSPVQ